MPTVRIITDLALYMKPGCFYCRRVLEALEALDLSIEERDISRIELFRDELREATGRTTVPMLKITDKQGQVSWMPESKDIIRYLRERFDTSGR